MLGLAEGVAANALPGCADPELVLLRTCATSRSQTPGSNYADFVFAG